MEPAFVKSISYIPGQFAYVSFSTEKLTNEAHPFTLSSTPSRPGTLQFTIRMSGDWTKKLKTLQPGVSAFVQGPFGRFSHLYTQPNRPLILIAVGIGITPMLSMLRYLADQNDRRDITLLWSN